MNRYIIIPARLNSTRFPNKALVKINNIPMVVRVYQQAMLVPDVNCVVATDSEEIVNICNEYGCHFVLTKEKHQNGTERCAEAARMLYIKGHDVVLNLQGDMPYIPPEICNMVLNSSVVNVSTAATRRYDNPSKDHDIVKVVVNSHGFAQYFTRSPLQSGAGCWYKHMGLYGMRNDILQHYARLPVSMLETAEGLEQLRFIEHGMPIFVHTFMMDVLSINNERDCLLLPTNTISWPERPLMGHYI